MYNSLSMYISLYSLYFDWAIPFLYKLGLGLTFFQFIEVVEFWIWSKSVLTRHKQKKAIKKTKENVYHLNISRLQPWDAIKLSQTNLQWSRKTLNEEPCHPINANWRKWRMFESVLIKKTLLHFKTFLSVTMNF